MEDERPLSSEEMIRRARERLAAEPAEPVDRDEPIEVEFEDDDDDEDEAAEIEFSATRRRTRPTRVRPQRPEWRPDGEVVARAQRFAAAIAVALLIAGIAVAVAVFAAGSS